MDRKIKQVTMKIPLFRADGLFMVRSYASANTLYFEEGEDHQLLLNYIDYFLGGMIEVIDYRLLPTGWVMLFRSKTANKIVRAYQRQRNKSRKSKVKDLSDSPGHIISEHFRFAISHYVRRSNQRHGRTGSKIHSRIEKTLVVDESDYRNRLESMAALESFWIQTVGRYQANKKHYGREDIEKNVALLGGRLGLENGIYVLKCLMKGEISMFVVRTLTKKTLKQYYPFSPP